MKKLFRSLSIVLCLTIVLTSVPVYAETLPVAGSSKEMVNASEPIAEEGIEEPMEEAKEEPLEEAEEEKQEHTSDSIEDESEQASEKEAAFDEQGEEAEQKPSEEEEENKTEQEEMLQEEDEEELEEAPLELSGLDDVSVEIVGGATYSSLTDAVSNVGSNGTIRLLTDVPLSETLKIVSSKKFTLDLNDCVLRLTGEGTVINNYGTLTINDSASDKTIRYWEPDAKGMWVETDSETEYTTSGGCITGGNIGQGSSSLMGGAIRNQKNTGVLTLKGGNIVGNSADYGGGIYTQNKLNIEGGTIVGNYVKSSGGGVYLSKGTMSFDGDSISYNNANDGGGVCVNVGTFTMKSGSIAYNKARNGGGVSNNAEFSMEGGEIKHNTATIYGGGIRNKKDTFTVSAGEITDNKSKKAGGGVYTGNIINLGGTTIITDNFTNGFNDNLYLSKDTGLVNVADPSTGFKVGVSMSDPGKITSGDYHTYFESDDIGYEPKYSGTDTILGLKDICLIYSQEDITRCLESKATTQTWEIQNDICLSMKISAANKYKLTVNGNGYKLYADPVNFTGNTLFYTRKNVTLNDITLKAGGTAKHVLILQNSPEAALTDVTIDHRNVTAEDGGAPIINNWSNVTISGSFEVYMGNQSWYAVNVDATEPAALTISDDVEATFHDSRKRFRKKPLITIDGPLDNATIAGTDNIGFVYVEKHLPTGEAYKGYDPEEYTKKQSSSTSDENSVTPKLYTGTPEKPVSDGKWIYHAGTDSWSYVTTAQFINTWAYLENPYADETIGQPRYGWFYFDRDGRLLTGWQMINGKWYFLEPKKNGTLGMCYINTTTPDGYKVGADGARIQ